LAFAFEQFVEPDLRVEVAVVVVVAVVVAAVVVVGKIERIAVAHFEDGKVVVDKRIGSVPSLAVVVVVAAAVGTMKLLLLLTIVNH